MFLLIPLCMIYTHIHYTHIHTHDTHTHKDRNDMVVVFLYARVK